MTKLGEGPGTELAKLIHWFAKKSSSCGRCNRRARLMNEWGIEGCKERKSEIVEWLATESKKRNPLRVAAPRTAIEMLLKLAIINASKAAKGHRPHAVPASVIDLVVDPQEREVVTPVLENTPPRQDADFTVEQWPFVWTYFAAGAIGDELKYSIASVKKWHPDARVIVIGDKPDWYSGEFIHKPRIGRTQHQAFKDCYSKLLMASETISRFIWMMDDIYWVKPFTIEEAATPKYVRYGTQQSFMSWNPKNKWAKTRAAAYEWLLANNCPTYDFASHLPQPVYSETFLLNESELNLMQDYKNWECVYYNRFHARHAQDWGRRTTRVTKAKDTINEPRYNVLNHTNSAFRGGVESYLQERIGDSFNPKLKI